MRSLGGGPLRPYDCPRRRPAGRRDRGTGKLQDGGSNGAMLPRAQKPQRWQRSTTSWKAAWNQFPHGSAGTSLPASGLAPPAPECRHTSFLLLKLLALWCLVPAVRGHAYTWRVRSPYKARHPVGNTISTQCAYTSHSDGFFTWPVS